MTDREMLLMAYGALRVVVVDIESLKSVTELVERHLYPDNCEKKEMISNTKFEREFGAK
jgi:hypothetical protein